MAELKLGVTLTQKVPHKGADVPRWLLERSLCLTTGSPLTETRREDSEAGAILISLGGKAKGVRC